MRHNPGTCWGSSTQKKSCHLGCAASTIAALVAEVILKLWNIYREVLGRLSREAISLARFAIVFLPLAGFSTCQTVGQ
jgi:hypothetical protein